MSPAAVRLAIHTEMLKDKSFWLALLLPAAFIVTRAVGVIFSASEIAAICALPGAYITMSKGKQAYVLGKTTSEGA